MFGGPSHRRCPTQRGRGRCPAVCSPAEQPRSPPLRVCAEEQRGPGPARCSAICRSESPFCVPAVAGSAAQEGAGGTRRGRARPGGCDTRPGPRSESTDRAPSAPTALRADAASACRGSVRVCLLHASPARPRLYHTHIFHSHSHNGKKWDISLSYLDHILRKQLIWVRWSSGAIFCPKTGLAARLPSETPQFKPRRYKKCLHCEFLSTKPRRGTALLGIAG